ncbi:hypothetical protein EVAR_64318_1 [Eumeta japonica]|uniref:Uncharacterized protein n=1 Tax=Eumeta variegata TaxID=151549 RepID=A0A4C2A582_EUMVA|nr:hypothetical protein EVAR_64318_1 [Eumeta japonica]
MWVEMMMDKSSSVDVKHVGPRASGTEWVPFQMLKLGSEKHFKLWRARRTKMMSFVLSASSLTIQTYVHRLPDLLR